MGTSNSSPRESMTARSMKFASSRTLPGHGLFVRAPWFAGGMELICLPHAPGELRHKIVHQQRNVLAPFAKRRDLNRKDVKAIEQVLAKLLLPNHGGKVAMGGGNDAHIDLIVLALPRRSNSCSCTARSSFGCSSRLISPISSRNSEPWSASSNLSLSSASGLR